MCKYQLNGYCVASMSEGMKTLKHCVKDKLLLSGVDINDLTDYGILIYATVLIDSLPPSGNGYCQGLELTSLDIDIFNPPPPPPSPTHKEKIEIWKADMERYYKSAYWFNVRKEALRLSGYRCIECDTTMYLQIHHLNYDNVGEELQEYLQVLCHSCHSKLHRAKERNHDRPG